MNSLCKNSSLEQRNGLMRLKQLLLTLVLCIITSFASATRFDHTIWDGLLREHVYMMDQGQTSRVNYFGFASNHGQLHKYLSQLSAVKEKDFSSLDKSEQLAFLINTYNAFTVEMILRSYSSIATLRAYAPVNIHWKSRLISMLRNQRELKFIPLFGKFLSLDDIEEGMIRRPGSYDEPRIHFALNRASIGCPALLNRAYSGIELEHQLEAATRAFLSDRSRNRFNEEAERLEVSEIFDWYSEDFERNWQGWTGLAQFFAHYRDSLADTPHARELLTAGNLEIQFLEFNWMLNEKQWSGY
ncbi:DUF547 domain-containing protein [Nitrosomonas sp. Nm166]|uniref:DUF547 domain-containing protein n=1 Tax=Nitrosomonas sp. Nm166 TaxID=1881054 RepID=UPI0008E41F47|nr:DUF547 domain-containing protein [Nitrosomonas sp. Nm166]SFE28792.1 Protein of unknown function, DUF547 [Nitrosomonas sp. Nm166]